MANFSKFMLKLINFFVTIFLLISAIGSGMLIGFHLNGDFEKVDATVVREDGMNFLEEYKYFVKYSYDNEDYSPEWPITSFEELKEGDKISVFVIGDNFDQDKIPASQMIPDLVGSIKWGVLILLACTMITTLLNAGVRLISLNQRFPEKVSKNVTKIIFDLLGSVCTYALLILILNEFWENQSFSISLIELMPAIIGIVVARIFFAVMSVMTGKEKVVMSTVEADEWQMSESNGLVENSEDDDEDDDNKENKDIFEL